MQAAAQRIIDGPAMIFFEGDSLYSTATPRMQQGVAQHWRVNTVTGMTAIGGCQHWDIALSGGGAGRTNTQREDSWYGAGPDQTVAPIAVNEIAWSANESGGFHRITVNNTARQWFANGDPWSNVAINADFVYFADAANSIAQARFRGRRSGDQAINNFDNVNIAGPVGGALQHYEVAIPAAVNASDNLPSMDILAATGYDETGRKWWPVACRFYRPGVVGTQFCFVSARGGWTAADHINQAKCSDARRLEFYSILGKPNVFWIMLGTNGWNQAHVESMINNRRQLMNQLGVQPLFVLEAPYENANTVGNGATIAADMHRLSQVYSDVGFVNTFGMAARLGVASGLFVDGGDQIHQIAAGASYYPAISWAALYAAYFGSGQRNLRNRIRLP